MRKRLYLAALTAALTLGAAATSYAAQWVPDTNGWWYQEDDGSWPSNTWKWIDGNQDGVAECYYFGPNGYIYTSTTTPDGYTVDGNGAWTVNGAVQTQVAGGNTSGGSQAASQTAEINRRAVAAYREKISEYMVKPLSYNGGEIPIRSFAVADLNGDNIFEALVGFEDPSGMTILNAGVILYYTDHLCEEVLSSGYEGTGFSYNPHTRLISTGGYARGYIGYSIYEFDEQSVLTERGSFSQNMRSGEASLSIDQEFISEPEDILNWAKEFDNGGFTLPQVDATQEMVEQYLSGDGQATSVLPSSLSDSVLSNMNGN